MCPCFFAIVVLWLIHPPLLLAKVTTTFEAPPTAGIETTIPGLCTHGENVAIPKDCHYYYYCAYGFLVRRECSPIGYVFSRSKGYCVPTYSPSNDCGLEIATESAATTKACISGLLYQNPANCGSYFLCYSGTFIQKYCSQNRVYSNSRQRCVDPSSAYSDCPSLTSTTAIIEMTVKTTTPAAVIEPTTESDDEPKLFACSPGDMYRSRHDSSIYYVCQYGFYVQKHCYGDQVFSHEWQSCVNAQSSYSDCTIESIAAVVHSGDHYRSPEDCSIYYVCQHGSLVQKQCHDDRVFSNSKGTCVYRNSASDDCIQTTTTATIKATTEAIGTMTPSCTIGMLFPDLDDCQSYYDCTFGHTLIKNKCYSGHVFSYSKKRCVTKGSIGDDCTPATTTATIKETEAPTTELIGTMTPTCTPGDSLPDPDDCQSYYHCTYSRTLTLKKCHPDNVFSQSKKRCVSRGSISDDCTPGVETTSVCKFGETVPDERSCNAYYICYSGELSLKFCPLYSTFSRNLGHCVPQDSYYNDCHYHHTSLSDHLYTPAAPSILTSDLLAVPASHQPVARHLLTAVAFYLVYLLGNKHLILSDVSAGRSVTVMIFVFAVSTLAPVTEAIKEGDSCIAHSVHRDPNDCKFYYICEFRRMERKYCPANMVYSNRRNLCVYTGSVYNDCSPQVDDGVTPIIDIADSVMPSIVFTDGVTSIIGNDVMHITAITDSVPPIRHAASSVALFTPTTETTPLCTPGNSVPDPDDCQSYNHCTPSRTMIKKKCPADEVFSRSKKRCVTRGTSFDDCSLVAGSLTPMTFTTETTHPVCTPGDSFPDGDDCQSYYHCTYSQTVIKKKCHPDKIFSQSKKRCVTRGSRFDDCSAGFETTALCIPGDVFPDPKDCQSYCHCTYKLTVIKKKCSPEQVFSSSKKRCVSKGTSDDDCSRAIETTASLCTPGDSLPDPDDCRSYYHCTFSRTVIKKDCPVDKVFSRSKKRCVSKSSSFDDCSLVVSTGVMTTETSKVTASLCTPGDSLPDPDDCQSYYHCTFKQTVIKKDCPADKVFSRSKKRCVSRGSSFDDCSLAVTTESVTTESIETTASHCTPGDSLPDLDNCRSYYHCTFRRTVIKKDCHANKVFSRSKKRCVTKGSSFDDCSLDYRKPKEYPTKNRKPKEYLTDYRKPKEYSTDYPVLTEVDYPKTKEYPTDYPVVTEVDYPNPEEYPTDYPVVTEEVHRKPKKYPTVYRKPKKYPTNNRKPKEYPTDYHKPKEYPTDYPVVTEVDYPKPKEYPTDYPVVTEVEYPKAKEYPTDYRKPKEYPTYDRKPKEYPTDYRKPKEYPTDYHKPKEYPTDDHKPKEYPTDSGKPKEYPTDYLVTEVDYPKPKEYPTDYPVVTEVEYPKAKEYPTDYRKPKEYPTDYRKRKEYPTDYRKPKEYPTDYRKPKEYPTDYSVVTEVDYPKPKEYPTDYPVVTEVAEYPKAKEYPTDYRKPKEYPTYDRKPKEYPTDYRKPKEYPTDDRKPKEYPTNDHKPKEYPTDYPVVTEVDYPKPKEYPTDYPVVTEVAEYPKAKEYPTDYRKPKEYPTYDRKPKEYPTDYRKPKEYPTDYHKPNEYPTDYPVVTEVDYPKPKEYPTDYPVVTEVAEYPKAKEYPTDYRKPKEYPTYDRKPKEYPTDYRKPKEYPTDDNKPKEYPTDDHKPKEYPTDYPVVTEVDYPKPKEYPTDYPVVTEVDYPKPKEYPTDYPVVTEVEYPKAKEYPTDYRKPKEYPTDYRKPKEYPTDYRKPKEYPTDYHKPKEYPTDYPVVTEVDYPKPREYPTDYRKPREYSTVDYPKPKEYPTEYHVVTDYPVVTEVDYPTDYPVVTEIEPEMTTIECKNGKKFSDPDDCRAYYLCRFGGLVRRHCPHGLHFRKSSGTCVIAYGPHDSCAETSKKECVQGQTERNHYNCSSYYACSDERFQLKYCPIGQVYSSFKKSCVKQYGYYDDCSTRVASSSHVLIQAAEECRHRQKVPNPTNCRKFFICSKRKLEDRHCQFGKVFSITKRRCVKANGPHDDCTQREKPQTTAEIETTSIPIDIKSTGGTPLTSAVIGINSTAVNSSSTGLASTMVTIQAVKECEPGHKVPNPTNCMKFIVCNNGKLEDRQCHNGKVFSITKKRCVKVNGPNDDCTKSGTPLTTGNETNGTAVSSSTGGTPLTTGNETNATAVSSSTGGTPFINAVMNTKATSVNSSIGLASTMVTTRAVKDCKHGHKVPNPTNCMKFIECNYGKLEDKQCNYGNVFSISKKRCVKVNGPNDDCTKSQTATVTSKIETVTSIINSSSTVHYDTTMGKGHYLCEEGYTYSHHNDCTYFYICKAGQLILQRCPFHHYFYYVFSPRTGMCVPPYSSNDDCTEYFTKAKTTRALATGSVTTPTSTNPNPYITTNETCTNHSTQQSVPTTPKLCKQAYDFYPRPSFGLCSAYIECASGMEVRKYCNKGMVFSKFKRECVFHTSPFNDCFKRGETIISVQATSPGVLSTSSPECVNGTRLAVRGNCYRFKECVDGYFVLQYCQKEKLFNAETLICERHYKCPYMDPYWT